MRTASSRCLLRRGARRIVEEHLGVASADEIADVKLVVSELVSNAFLHGKGGIALRLSNRRGRVRIEVIDEGDGATVRASRQDEYHGLEIVDALALGVGSARRQHSCLGRAIGFDGTIRMPAVVKLGPV